MRYGIRLAVAISSVLTALGVGPTEARRVALVVGSAEYKVGRLANPVNDAAAVAETLENRLKFDKVLLRPNLNLDGFRAALREIATQSRGAEVGVVFFAGHGIELGDRNYLIPTDAALAASADIELEAIALDTVLRQLEGATRLRLVILDACRNNPFPAATRSVRGLGRIEPDLGTLVAYAAKDGTLAEDGKGPHSPFTAALLKRIVAPGLDVRRVFGYVREDVMAATGRKQEPYLYGRLGGDEVYLAKLAPKPVEVPVPRPPSEAAEAWAAAKDSTSIGVLEGFRRQYGANLFYDRLAAKRIDELRRDQLAMLKADEDRKRAEEEKKAEADLRPGRVFRDCPDVCPEMVILPAGEFIMGSNEYDTMKPPHKVTIARPFAIGKFEVTFAEWDACAADGGCTYRPSDQGWGRGRRPVINVSWHDAKEYVGWLSRKTGKSYRLLSEAEWEYAARGGTTTRYAFGDTISKSHALYSAGKTAEVGSFSANRFGLNDMHGNVWEWVEDAWHPNYQGAPVDGSVWQGGDATYHVLRGGSWNDYPGILRSDVRGRYPPDVRIDYIGFRVASTRW